MGQGGLYQPPECNAPVATNRRLVLLVSQPGFDQLDDRRVIGLGARTKSAHHVPLAVDHELLKIPGHLASTLWLGIQASQVLVEGGSGIPVDLNLGEHVESHVVLVRAECPDLACRARFLVVELVTGESSNGKTLLGVLPVQCLQLQVLGSKASPAGDIHHQDNFALVLGERHVLPLQ